ncbi:MAG: MjaI family restriction endonuclease [Thermoplasmatales archaeon]
MAKEWILNSATNRFQLNFSRNVGRVSEEIRKCSPRTLNDWETYYYSNVYPKEHLVDLGRKLYVKITEVLAAEIEDITENDCIDFIETLVINRTFDGYMTEKQTIYGQLQDILGVKIEPAPDDWDRLYNVDFYIKIKERYLGLQIKPVSGTSHIPEIFKERSLQLKTHEKFTEKYGGNVFYVISIKNGDKKIIYNTDVIEEIKSEIKRLQS